jgi:hypothetical protein
MEPTIKNRVAESGIITLDPESFLPKVNMVALDISPWLYEGLVLKEKDFREHLRNHPWQQYAGSAIAVHCSADAIIPTWAFMLVSQALQPFASKIFYGNLSQMKEWMVLQAINQMPVDDFAHKRVVIKGCSNENFSPAVYMQLTEKLMPVAKSIMYGEPCSTVPVFKAK